eukprot:gnl/TRDRNA2_/TRDRNA2_80363_c0_seq1.p1 gnl/TRDRNA2_/TRDRNA2_80363_c0~~gnl/TRDRNA2_/TRDRNA2_80363_c0_seq1.p1  ORF type:complete len:179 (-),score=18.97 gnl/TRDRNA2_/TRDRNA2_80363_c0_seq1:239-775(-)
MPAQLENGYREAVRPQLPVNSTGCCGLFPTMWSSTNSCTAPPSLPSADSCWPPHLADLQGSKKTFEEDVIAADALCKPRQACLPLRPPRAPPEVTVVDDDEELARPAAGWVPEPVRLVRHNIKRRTMPAMSPIAAFSHLSPAQEYRAGHDEIHGTPVSCQKYELGGNSAGLLASSNRQ